ncbi:hypothetical protein DFQ26_002053, partial [Actinomortierella ambigua]
CTGLNPIACCVVPIWKALRTPLDASYEHLDPDDQQLMMAMPEIQSQVASSATGHPSYD